MHFILTVATSADDFISRSTDEPPQEWASAEEQALFFNDVEAADWAIMGRNTHEAADKPHRRRIIFSTSKRGWQRDTQLWLNPENLTPNDLKTQVRERFPLVNGLILGGTRVHDWFLVHDAIDKIHLTVEPVVFEAGLDIFSNQVSRDPVEVLMQSGFEIDVDTRLNDAGTRYYEFSRHDPQK